jgi:hypothetical protein
MTVVGVLPASFDFATVFAAGSHIDLFVPFPLTPETNQWGNTLAMVGRLKPGISPSAAQAEMRILGEQLTAEHKERNTFEGRITPLAEHVSGRFRLALWVLTGAVAVVMLIVCANLSNLLLARTAARQKEIAVRTALGAGRGRLLLQMLTEGVTLSGCGALVGVVLAIAGTRGVAHLEAVSIPLLENVRLDAMTLGFTLIMAMATGIVFGLAPAIQVSAAALHDVLKDANRGSTQGRRPWLRGALVVSEIAFACVLLVGAGLLIRSFARLLEVDLGFHPERAASIRVDPDPQYKTGEQQNAYYDEVLRLVKTVPGIQAAGLTDVLPLGRNRSWGAPEKGQVYPKGSFPVAFVRIVTDGYIGAMGIPLRAGRDFTARDTIGSTGDRDQRNHGTAYVPGPRPARQDDHGMRFTAGDRRRRRCAASEPRRERRHGNVCADAAVPRCPVGGPGGADDAAGIGAAGRGSRSAAAGGAEHLGERLPHAPATGGQIGFAAPLRDADAGRLRAVRAGAGVARHLRRDLLFGESADAGDRNPDGAGRASEPRAGGHPGTDAQYGGDRHRPGRRGLMGVGAVAQRAAVFGFGRRSLDLRRNADRADGGGGDRWLRSGSAGVAHRPVGGAAGKLIVAEEVVQLTSGHQALETAEDSVARNLAGRA